MSRCSQVRSSCRDFIGRNLIVQSKFHLDALCVIYIKKTRIQFSLHVGWHHQFRLVCMHSPVLSSQRDGWLFVAQVTHSHHHLEWSKRATHNANIIREFEPLIKLSLVFSMKPWLEFLNNKLSFFSLPFLFLLWFFM